MNPAVADQIAVSIRALIRDEFPQLTYSTTWEYAITSANADGTVNGVATSPIPLPPLNNVPIASLVLGGVCAPVIGSNFLVDFINQDGARYAVISAEAARVATVDASESIEVGESATVKLGPEGAQPVGREGDKVTVFFPVGILTGTLNGSPYTGRLSILSPTSGIVTSGAERVHA